MVPQSEALWGGSAQIQISQWSSGLARCSCGKSLLYERSDIIFFFLTDFHKWLWRKRFYCARYYKWNHKGKPWGCCTTMQQPLKLHNAWRNSFMTSNSALPPRNIPAWFFSDGDPLRFLRPCYSPKAASRSSPLVLLPPTSREGKTYCALVNMTSHYVTK